MIRNNFQMTEPAYVPNTPVSLSKICFSLTLETCRPVYPPPHQQEQPAPRKASETQPNHSSLPEKVQVNKMETNKCYLEKIPPPLAVGLQQTLFEVFSHIISLFTQNYETWTRHLINLILVWPSDIFECFPDVTIRHIWMLFNSFFKFQLVLLPFQQTKM